METTHYDSDSVAEDPDLLGPESPEEMQKSTMSNAATVKLKPPKPIPQETCVTCHVSCCWFALVECRYTPVYLDEVIEDVHAVVNFGSMSTLQVISQMLSVGRFHFGHIGLGLNGSRQSLR